MKLNKILKNAKWNKINQTNLKKTTKKLNQTKQNTDKPTTNQAGKTPKMLRLPWGSKNISPMKKSISISWPKEFIIIRDIHI